jgi:cytochrome d ubiquinol oxidase subunit II
VTDLPASLGYADVVACAMMIALTAYALMGGADFGGGVWDLLASGSRRDAQRALISSAIAPIWEANHVWLIIVIVALFTGFPDAFATLGTVLHIPLTLMLVGIVLRGSAFVFRSYGARDTRAQLRWGRVFAISSLITPLLLGVIVGAIASGNVGDAAARIPVNAHDAPGAGSIAVSFADLYVAPWLAPFPLAVGALALALFAFLAAVYLILATDDEGLREDFRQRALVAAGVVFVVAFLALAVAHLDAPAMGRGLVGSGEAIAFHVATGAAAVSAIWALWSRHYQLARLAAAAQVSLVLWGWALVQYPLLVPPSGSISALAAPAVTLRLLLIALACGSVILLPSLVYLFRTFGSNRVERH